MTLLTVVYKLSVIKTLYFYYIHMVEVRLCSIDGRFQTQKSGFCATMKPGLKVLGNPVKKWYYTVPR